MVESRKKSAGVFTGGEVKDLTSATTPEGLDIFNALEGGFLGDEGSFYTRKRFRALTSVVTKDPNFYSAKIYAYTTTSGVYANRVVVFQFCETPPNATLARVVRYTIIDIENDLILQNNVEFPDSYRFFDEHFDIAAVRRASDEVQAGRRFYFFGTSRLLEVEINDVTGVGIFRIFTVSHPYAWTTLGGLIVFFCYAEKGKNSNIFEEDKAFGTKAVFAVYPLKSSREGQTQTWNIETTLTVGVNVGIGERLLRLSTFADSVFLVATAGLFVLVVQDIAVISGGGVYQRRVSVFNGKNVRPVAVQGQFLYYAASEIRVRDVSSMEANIQFAGDYVAAPAAEAFEALTSGTLFGEDTAMFLVKDRRTIKTMTAFNLGGGVVRHSVTTFFKSSEDILDTVFGGYDNWFFVRDPGTGFLEVVEYNSRSEATELEVDVRLKLARFAYIPNFSGLKIFIDTQGEEFTKVPAQRIDYDVEGVVLLDALKQDGGTAVSPGWDITFSALGEMRVVLYEVEYRFIAGY